jgi:hypothetical protein
VAVGTGSEILLFRDRERSGFLSFLPSGGTVRKLPTMVKFHGALWMYEKIIPVIVKLDPFS